MSTSVDEAPEGDGGEVGAGEVFLIVRSEEPYSFVMRSWIVKVDV
jgi:hypothetical protein